MSTRQRILITESETRRMMHLVTLYRACKSSPGPTRGSPQYEWPYGPPCVLWSPDLESGVRRELSQLQVTEGRHFEGGRGRAKTGAMIPCLVITVGRRTIFSSYPNNQLPESEPEKRNSPLFSEEDERSELIWTIIVLTSVLRRQTGDTGD